MKGVSGNMTTKFAVIADGYFQNHDVTGNC